MGRTDGRTDVVQHLMRPTGGPHNKEYSTGLSLGFLLRARDPYDTVARGQLTSRIRLKARQCKDGLRFDSIRQMAALFTRLL